MKKSECFKMAQIAVIESELDPGEKVEIVKYLIEEENLAKYIEKGNEVKEDA